MGSSSDAGLGRRGEGASPGAIAHHYDVGSDFYRLWLDERMVYSCALWDGPLDDRLEDAQLAKLTWHASSMRAGAAARVLDVGCGWGAMLRHLVEESGVGHATGLTLSEDQHAVVAATSPPSVEVRLEDWRQHRPAAPYDAIVSIGAFEHFARNDLGGGERRREYADFFSTCAGWLPEGGRLSLQTIAYDDFDPATTEVSAFFREEVFPESSLPLLTDITVSSDPWFRIVGMRSDGDQYEHTLRLWQQRLELRREAAEALVGRDTVRHYLRYLRVSRAMFDRRVCTLHRITFERRAQPVRLADAGIPTRG